MCGEGRGEEVCVVREGGGGMCGEGALARLGSIVIVACGKSRNVRNVRIYPLKVLFTFTMVIIV